ncbi:hypothetical protein DVH24_027756 [Malus domestica]|uniref:Uncharacterized protein n=1 Tax=Malus domestica TaxID=3750 RepID=A0A498H9E1_MALDO|nr:hypothetical protein DVH24_027756 [Malus domestica]
MVAGSILDGSDVLLVVATRPVNRRRDRWCRRGGRDIGEKSEYKVGVAKVDVVKEDMIGVDGLETLDS